MTAKRESVRPFSLGEKERMRGSSDQKIGLIDPLTPTLSRRERGFMGQRRPE